MVALVIAIILLLILAGITISQLTGSRLFENAKLAEQKSKEGQKQEEQILTDYENKIEGHLNGNRNTSTFNIVKLGEATGTTPVEIDASQYDALYIKTLEGKNNNACTYNIYSIDLVEQLQNYIGNGTWDGNGTWSQISVSKTQVKIHHIRYNNTDYTSTSTIKVYGINY